MEEPIEQEPEEVLKSRSKVSRGVYILPNVCTLGNMFAGFYAVIAVLQNHYDSAAIAIGIAVVLDGLDGRIARLANSTSDFGVQLDSLADMISFGIAPAVLIYSWGLAGFGKFANFSAFLFLVCGAIRLARFNLDLAGKKSFVGLPIPAAAGFLAATVHFFGEPSQSLFFRVYLVVAIYILSFLMVSALRYPSFKKLNFGYGKSGRNVLVLGLLVAGVVWYSEQVLMAISALYVCSGLVISSYRFVRYQVQNNKVFRTGI